MYERSASHEQLNLYTTLDIKDKGVEHFLAVAGIWYKKSTSLPKLYQEQYCLSFFAKNDCSADRLLVQKQRGICIVSLD